MTEKLADHVYGAEIPPGSMPRACGTCGAEIVWGLTNKGRRAPFDFPASEYGYVNHWVTCKHPPGRKR